MNRITDLARYFGMFSLEPDVYDWLGIDEEFWIFWDSLTEEEMAYYENVELA